MFFGRRKKLAQEIATLREELTTVRNELSAREEDFLKDFVVGGWNANQIMTSDSAMKVSAVFACTRLIAGAISSINVEIHKSDGKGGSEEVFDHPYKNLLSLAPNGSITGSTFWKTMVANKVLNGNAYAPIIRAQSGRPVGLLPIHPKRVQPYQAWELELDKQLNVPWYYLYYKVQWDNKESTLIDQADMLHIPNVGWDGKEGMSTIKAGAQAIDLAGSAEESASKLFNNGMLNNVAISYPDSSGKIPDDAKEALRKSIESLHAGSKNHYRPLILTDGGDIKTMQMNAGDAQLVESRAYSVIDVCRFFGVPPVMVGETEKTSSWGSGVEQMARWFVMFTLNDHLTDIEQELKRKLFTKSNYFAKFDEKELTRGDTKTRAEYNKAALGGTQAPAWMTQNEVRATENLPPIEGGDKLFNPVGDSDDDTQQADAVV